MPCEFRKPEPKRDSSPAQMVLFNDNIRYTTEF